MDMDEIKIEQTNLQIEDQQQSPYKHEQPQKNRNLITALIIGGVALGFIALLIVILMSTGWLQRKTGNIGSFGYAPSKKTSIATFDLGMNLGDLANSMANIAKMSGQAENPELSEILKIMPDLSFVDVKGFALLDQEDSRNMIVGLGYSGRSDPKKSLEGILETFSGKEGMDYQKDGNGFYTLMSGKTETGSIYLDDNYMLFGSSKEHIVKCLETKNNGTASLTNHPKWSSIRDQIDGSPIAYCGIFDYMGKEIILVGNAQNLSNEVSFRLTWLDGVDQVQNLIGEQMPIDLDMKDFFKWQRNLSQTISATPDGTMRFAVPFAISDFMFPKPVEGEISGYVQIGSYPMSQTFGLRMKTGKEAIENMLSQLIPPGSKTTPQADGSVLVEPQSLTIPEMPKSPSEKNAKSLKPVPSQPYGRQNSAIDLFSAFGSEKLYYKNDGNTLTLGNAPQVTKWIPGRKEQVQGNIMALAIDGKSIIDAILPSLALYSGEIGSLPGMSAKDLSEILQKLDLRVNLDMLTNKKDLAVVLSIKYNLEKALR